MPREPRRVPPARMRQRQHVRQVALERLHRLGHRPQATLREVEGLRVRSDEERESNMWEVRSQPRLPERRAFSPGRAIRAVDRPGITEPDRDDRDDTFVVEPLAGHAEPRAQPVARRIVPRNARLVDAPPGGLPDDQQPRTRCDAQHRPRFVRQARSTDAARAHLGQQRVERRRRVAGPRLAHPIR